MDDDQIVFGEKYHTLFRPKVFLAQCYQFNDQKQRIHMKHLYDFYKSYSESHPQADKLKMLDLGCGPVIAYAISAAEYASEIVMAEYTELNRQEITKWINKDPDAHDWSPYLDHVIKEVEGKGNDEISIREDKLRKVMKVVPCDVTKDPMLSPEYVKEYDVVHASVVLEPACSTKDKYLLALKRIWLLLKPGGAFMLYSVLRKYEKLENTVFEIGGTKTFDLRVSEEFIESSLRSAGFRQDKILTITNFDEIDDDPKKYSLFISYK